MEHSTYPVLPLKNTVLFPHLVLPLSVGRAGSIAAVEAALASEDKLIAVFPQNDPRIEEPTASELFPFGAVGIIKKMARSGDTVQILIQGIERVEQLEIVQEEPYLSLKVATLPEPSDTSTEIEALHRTVIELAGRMIELVQPQVQVSIHHIISDVEKPLHQIYLLTSVLSLNFDKEKELLAASTQAEALHLMHRYLNHEVQVLEVRQKITSAAQTEIDKKQREYVLRQQLEAIQEELGEKSPEQAETKELRQRMEEADLPELVRKEVEKEITRLERMPSAAPDYQLTRGYVELTLDLPWNKATEDRLDLKRAREILDEDHFDLEDVKERIIEHLAVMKLNPKAKSPILCFVGPPGVGKTSVGKSIARALGRQFERMSLGGLHDEAELRGHRRTYIGAMPGRIIRALRRAGYKNPLLMLDEIDKLGRDFRGDPAAALLEVLDPAQNIEFHDNYLDLPFDLSKVFFVTTANTLDTIPRPLLDRMEILRLPGYSDEEKQHIARRYLIGRQIREAGLSEDQVSIPDETLSYIIRRYTREAGVRELERVLGRIARKVATQVAAGQVQPMTITPKDLSELMGPERFFAEEVRQQLPPGVAAGLAWTEAGGDVLYVEAVLLPEGKGLTLTGQLGNIMQESAKAAQSYLWAHAEKLRIDSKAIRESGVHIHIPAGAIPKDGPSAGVTMATALTSAYGRWSVHSNTAMTGEITLSGLVLPVGGIKEKVLAAHRSGIRRIILPKENEKDLQEIPEHVRQSIQFILVEQIEEVLTAAIPELEKLHSEEVA